MLELLLLKILLSIPQNLLKSVSLPFKKIAQGRRYRLVVSTVPQYRAVAALKKLGVKVSKRFQLPRLTCRENFRFSMV